MLLLQDPRVRQAVDQYERYPVSPREFIEDPYFLGDLVGNLHERWKEELEVVLDTNRGISEWILKGAIGTGKTTCAAIAQTYKIYMLSCLRDPAEYYGLLPGSRIVFGIFSITLSKADRGYELIKEFIDGCPYFKANCPRTLRPSDPIHLPSKNVRAETGSLASHALSENMFGFMIDEANFFKRSKEVLSSSDRTRAHQLYLQAQRRQLSRFMQYGTVPGLNCLISSQKTQTEFLEERVEKAKGNSTVHVTSFALWDTKPKTIYSGYTFRVMLGDGRLSSRLLDEDEIAPEGYEVITVPDEYRKPFEEEVDEALRDIAGQAVTGAGFFFAQRERLHLCLDRKRSHPFTQEEVIELNIETGDANLEEFMRPELLFHTIQSRPTLRCDPNIPRFGHVDIGLTGDSLGLAIGYETALGVLYFDILLRVRAPRRGEIDLDAIVDFFHYLRRCGFHFKSLTYDSYQSRHSIQRLKKLHFCAGTLSIGLDAYKELRRRIYSGTVSYYYYAPFLTEATQLLKDPAGGDPDHPKGGSNDVIDAAAGVAAAIGKMIGEKPARRPGGVLMPTIGANDSDRW